MTRCKPTDSWTNRRVFTLVVVASISVPSSPTTKTLSLKVKGANPRRIVITDDAGSRTRFQVTSDGTVTPL